MAKATQLEFPPQAEMSSSSQSVKFDSNLTTPPYNKSQGTNDSQQRLSKSNIDDIPIVSGRSSVTLVVDPDQIQDRPRNCRFPPCFSDEIDTTRADILLLACSFVSGVLDSAAFNAWGSFANMQSGMFLPLETGRVQHDT